MREERMGLTYGAPRIRVISFVMSVIAFMKASVVLQFS
jgi:hypothetical protein